MILYLADRLFVHFDHGLERLGMKYSPGLSTPPIDYLKMLYADTVLNGDSSALKCAFDFFVEDHLDMPYGIKNGTVSIRQTMNAIEVLEIPEKVRNKIYAEKAKQL